MPEAELKLPWTKRIEADLKSSLLQTTLWTHTQRSVQNRVRYLVLKYLRCNVDDNFSVLHVEEATKENVPLQDEASNNHVQTNSRESIALEKGHQETKTNEDHNVHILEH